MTSSSTDAAEATAARSRRVRLVWLLAVLVVALASPTLTTTRSTFGDTASATAEFGTLTTGPGLVELWDPVEWWRFDQVPPTGAAATGDPALAPSPLTKDTTGALELDADDAVAEGVSGVGAAWSAVAWVALGATDGQLLRVSGLDTAETVTTTVSVSVAGGTVQLFVDGTPVGTPVALAQDAPTLVAVTSDATGLTLVSDGQASTVPTPVDLRPTELRLGASAYTDPYPADASAAVVDELALVGRALTLPELEAVRTVPTWEPFA